MVWGDTGGDMGIFGLASLSSGDCVVVVAGAEKTWWLKLSSGTGSGGDMRLVISMAVFLPSPPIEAEAGCETVMLASIVRLWESKGFRERVKLVQREGTMGGRSG